MWRFGTLFWHSHVTNPSKGPGISPDFWTALAPLATCTTNYLPLHLPHHLVLNSPKFKKKNWPCQMTFITIPKHCPCFVFNIPWLHNPPYYRTPWARFTDGNQNPRQASCSVVLAMAKATFQAANFFGDECHGKVVESTGLKHIQAGFDGFCVLSSRLNLPHLLGQ